MKLRERLMAKQDQTKIDLLNWVEQFTPEPMHLSVHKGVLVLEYPFGQESFDDAVQAYAAQFGGAVCQHVLHKDEGILPSPLYHFLDGKIEDSLGEVDWTTRFIVGKQGKHANLIFDMCLEFALKAQTPVGHFIHLNFRVADPKAAGFDVVGLKPTHHNPKMRFVNYWSNAYYGFIEP